MQKPLINNYIDTLNEYGVGLLYTDNPDGSFQSNILEGFARAKEQESTGHCTTKPLALIEKLVQMLVPKSPSNVVLDPFAGSGTTLLACKNLGIPYVGIEISQEYVELAKKRLNPKRAPK